MRRGKDSDDVEKKNRSVDKEEEQEDVEEGTQRKLSGGSEQEEEIKFGEQLQDDLINSFCDKLEHACPQKLDALMAIQFLMITEVPDIQSHTSGKYPAYQVLYDRTRSHYVLVAYNPKYQKVFLYDSLQPYENDEPLVIRELAVLISRMFGHLFTKHIPIIVDKEFQRQNDTFSCGYRVIGALVDLARNRNPATQDYSRNAILNFLKFILAEPKPTWEMFKSASFACTKEYSGQHLVSLYIPNTTYVATSSTSRSSSQSSCKRTSSTDSLASQKSGNNSNGGRARKAGRRAHAGYYNPKLENYRNNSERYSKTMPRNLYPYRPSSPLSAPYFQPPPTSWSSHTALGSPPADNTLFTYFRNSYQTLFSQLSIRRKSESRSRSELEDDLEKGLGVEKRVGQKE